MVTRNWRGSLHIDPMRIFPNEDEAQAYANDMALVDMPRNIRIYLLSPDQQPKQIKFKLKSPE